MKKTQGDRLAAHLKRKAHTYLEMQMLGISTCPQKRVMEWFLMLGKDGRLNGATWTLSKGKRDGLVTWKIVRRK